MASSGFALVDSHRPHLRPPLPEAGCLTDTSEAIVVKFLEKYREMSRGAAKSSVVSSFLSHRESSFLSETKLGRRAIKTGGNKF